MGRNSSPHSLEVEITRLENQCKTLISALRKQEDLSEFEINRVMENSKEMLDHVLFTLQSRRKFRTYTSDKLILKLLKFLEENYHNSSLNVYEISKQLYIDRSQLYRRLKRQNLPAVSELLMIIRMEKASLMLRQSEKAINEISHACGYKSHSYFTKAFINRYEKTPTQFRKSHPEN